MTTSAATYAHLLTHISANERYPVTLRVEVRDPRLPGLWGGKWQWRLFSSLTGYAISGEVGFASEVEAEKDAVTFLQDVAYGIGPDGRDLGLEGRRRTFMHNGLFPDPVSRQAWLLGDPDWATAGSSLQARA